MVADGGVLTGSCAVVLHYIIMLQCSLFHIFEQQRAAVMPLP